MSRKLVKAISPNSKELSSKLTVNLETIAKINRNVITGHSDKKNENVTIYRLLSHVFRRPYLAVSPETSFIELGTYLAIGYQIYVDGLIVAVDKRLVGRLSGRHILNRIIKMKYNEWPSITADQLMELSLSSVDRQASLIQLLELFYESRFALAPITNKGVLIGSIGIRDVLPLIRELNLDTPITTICSPMITISSSLSLKAAIELMLQKNIRNVVIERDRPSDHYIINDRKILEFIFSYEGRKTIELNDCSAALSSISVDKIDSIPVVSVPKETTISKAATMLMNISTPLLVFDDYLVTPWDVVMKTTGIENLTPA